MISLQAIACFLAVAPWGVNGGACKPRSTDPMTTVSSAPTSIIASTVETTVSSIIESTESLSLATTSSEAATTTSSAPCPSYTQIIPPPSGKVCGKEVSRGQLDSSPLYIGSQLSTTGITGCAKYCGDKKGCVSFYAEDYVPGPGAPTFKICFMFKGYEKDIPFGPGQDGKPTYYELGCFACVRDVPQPPIPS
ncbi:hypothetical protein F53441_832 [Fusarium austroafricanum]|uniref:Apple domain-containing protein n=1 Tax=Fusarium austroafricanum TaxID=2364996 RepID=A0A8H4P4Q5_9HYPO|nr:hypothetical protein F53441_832 [Fusarium austroafricanum]